MPAKCKYERCVKCGKKLTEEEKKFAWIDGLCKNCYSKSVSGEPE